MTLIVAFPRTLTFTRAFEELPLFSEDAANGDLFFAGLIDGSIEISVDPWGNWRISDLHVSVKNARPTAAGINNKKVQLDPDLSPSLYWLVLDVFNGKYTATLEEWVSEATAEARLCGRAA
jgi:hypothetical protein